MSCSVSFVQLALTYIMGMSLVSPFCVIVAGLQLIVLCLFVFCLITTMACGFSSFFLHHTLSRTCLSETVYELSSNSIKSDVVSL